MGIFGLYCGLVFDLSRLGFLFHVVKEANDEEDNEGDNEEVNEGLDEISVVDCGSFNPGDVGGDSEF